MESNDTQAASARPLPWWALALVAVAATVLSLWTWQKWDTVWVERSESFFPPEWQNEDLDTLAWQYPISRSNDSYQWVHLADALAAGDRLPLHHRFDEGPPEGRPNRWHSGLAYALSASGSLVATLQDWPTERGIHYTAHWLGAAIHLAALIGGIILIQRLAGGRASLVFAGLYFFNAAVAWDFAFSRLDHEAVFQFFFLFHLIGLAGMLTREGRPSDRWALLAGTTAGFCWWISATVMAALSALVTLGILLECLRQQHREDNNTLARSLKIWGASSVAMILFFCLFDGRLDPEASIATLHPIFILVQAGAALVCLATLQRNKTSRATIFATGLLCGLSPLIWMAFYGAAAHPWLNPMMRRLHDYIVEFQSPFANGLWTQSETVQALAVGGLALAAAVSGRRLRAAWCFLALIAGLLNLSLLQTRWLGLAATTGTVALCLHLARTRSRALLYASCVLIALCVATWAHKWLTIEAKPGRIFVTDLMLQVGARDINLNLQRLSGGKPLHVAMPYAFSATSALFPEVHPLGTFYWENAEGIRASSDFFTGVDVDTPIDYAVVQGGRQGAPFAKLANWVAQEDVRPATIEASRAWRLSTQQEIDGWVEVPFLGTFGSQQFSVRLFRAP